MQAGDAGIAAEVEAGRAVEALPRRLDLLRQRRAPLDRAAERRTARIRRCHRRLALGGQSAVAPLRLMIGVITVSSCFMKLRRSSAEPPTGSMNWPASFSRTSGWASAALIS